METDLEMLAGAANEGDRRALEELILAVQDRIYALAVRMLYNPSDAEDAAQEILLKIITHLGTFRGESAFSTWMYRVAANHLLNMRKRRAESSALSFEDYEKALELETTGNWNEAQTSIIDKIFIDEIRISCLQGLLLCLDRDHRLVYLLADVFDFKSKEGADILGITPEAFRKRLSRSRSRIHGFFAKNCTLINPDNPCKCERYIQTYLQDGIPDKGKIIFAKYPCQVRQEENLSIHKRELSELKRMAMLYKQYDALGSPSRCMDNLGSLLKSKQSNYL